MPPEVREQIAAEAETILRRMHDVEEWKTVCRGAEALGTDPYAAITDIFIGGIRKAIDDHGYAIVEAKT